MIGAAAVGAVAYGVSDFTGGYAARRLPPARLFFTSRLMVVAALAVAAPLTGQLDLAGFLWGVAAGPVGFAGMILLYAAFSAGAMSVAAALVSCSTAAVPVAVGVATGDRVPPLAWVGIAAAAAAIPLVCRDPGEAAPGRDALRYGAAVPALAGGACLGGFTALTSRTDPATGLWPLLAAQTVMLGLAAAAAALDTAETPPGPATVLLPAAAGGAELTADAFALVAARANLAVAGPILALAPAATVLLARVVTGERVGWTRAAGLAAAVTAVALLGAAT